MTQNSPQRTQSLIDKNTTVDIPIYGRIWQWLKYFPQGLAVGAKNPPQGSGLAAAALISASFGCFYMMVNQHLTIVFKSWEEFVWMLGGWIPGSRTANKLFGELGPYSGKQTLLLLGWLNCWFLLHTLWSRKTIKFSTMFFWMAFLLVAATVMNWHPLFPYMPLMPNK
jgi:hypothetical protein